MIHSWLYKRGQRANVTHGIQLEAMSLNIKALTYEAGLQIKLDFSEKMRSKPSRQQLSSLKKTESASWNIVPMGDDVGGDANSCNIILNVNKKTKYTPEDLPSQRSIKVYLLDKL